MLPSKPTIKIAIVIGSIVALTAYTYFMVIPRLLMPAHQADDLRRDGSIKPAAKEGLTTGNWPNVDQPNKPQPPLGTGSSEERFKKMQALISLSASDELSVPEQYKVVEQILAEMPYMVKDGHMNPTEATFAHMVLLQRINKEVTADMMDDLKRKYTSIYPKEREPTSTFNFN
jgi:hypothetical protein